MTTPGEVDTEVSFDEIHENIHIQIRGKSFMEAFKSHGMAVAVDLAIKEVSVQLAKKIVERHGEELLDAAGRKIAELAWKEKSG